MQILRECHKITVVLHPMLWDSIIIIIIIFIIIIIIICHNDKG